MNAATCIVCLVVAIMVLAAIRTLRRRPRGCCSTQEHNSKEKCSSSSGQGCGACSASCPLKGNRIG